MSLNESIFLVCFFVVLLCFAPAVSSSVLNPNVDDDEYFSETFTLLADLENGAYIYGQIGVSNIGPGDKRGVCRILISEPEQEPLDKSVIVSNKEWFFSSEVQQVLSVKDCKLSYSDKGKILEFAGKIENQQINIILHSEVGIHPVPFNRISTKSGYYQADVLVPWAVATVKYQIGDKKNHAKGFGYADHSRSTLLPTKIAHEWLRFRGLNGSNSTIFLARKATKGKAFQGWVWRRKKQTPDIFEKLTLSTNVVSGIQHWNILVQDKTERYEIRTKNRLLRSAPLEEKGFIVKMLSYVVGNPVTYTYRAELTSSDGEGVSGILEVAKINGE